MPWIPRGLGEGIVTSRYPARPDGYGESFRGAVAVRDASAVAGSGGPQGGRGGSGTGPDGVGAGLDGAGTGPDGVGAGPDGVVTYRREVEQFCPTNAISAEGGRLRLDRGRCILCGRCAERHPDLFAVDAGFETAASSRHALVVPNLPEDESAIEQARQELGRRTGALRRSVHIRHVDAGSDGAEEWEIAALTNPVYDVQRLGIYFTASPRHADLLLVTGIGAEGMVGPLRETYEVMPHPKVVIAAGVDAVSGGLVGAGYASRGGVSDIVPVDVFVPGSPPSPFGLLFAILLAVGRLR